ncbi:hypothetical protein COY61_00695 [bacterium (Candidatus Gribaldobacteria) CG_4_10_14_0_8_um_filter_33_9]|uniref:GIY-YIG domain-containing protein n=1 Tax=bacterium (Candidatus Gribaldobacteria) CG_4_10_14_0_8_um_filter_33_9 TaxID=2014266 RepID=A0A2M7RNR4_9BACT|nr:MAG: hypothetical protein COY61_00695 [bacterium (Candidatus Gribaldobacteria) CG_4_10_14_0_8_um_filter_33_9]
MFVNWGKCTGGHWCNLLRLNLNDNYFDNISGVYIIWHGGNSPKTVKVGQGDIKDRLLKHSADPEILQYKNLTLYVSWATLSSNYMDGVEKYLGESLKPLVGSIFPDVNPISVNFPWS